MLSIILVLLLTLPSDFSAGDPISTFEAETLEVKRAHQTLEAIEKEIERARREGAFDGPEPIELVVPEPTMVVLELDVGEATFYGGRFHGRRTASGEHFDQFAMTAAHRTYPFGTIVRVTNPRNGRSVIVRINDRGPFGKAKKAARKIIDVSRAAAEELGFVKEGRIVAEVEVLEWGPRH